MLEVNLEAQNRHGSMDSICLTRQSTRTRLRRAGYLIR